jgi:hypothetical protein
MEPTNGFQLRFKKIKINHNLMVSLTIVPDIVASGTPADSK